MIRPYADDDLADVLDAWHAASVIAHSFLMPSFFEEERVRMAVQWMPASEAYVFERDGRVVGFVALAGEEVGGLFVHPDHQGEGVGRALMDHVVSLRSTVELEVFQRNAIGRRFYDAYGFTFVDAHPEPTTGETVHRLRFG